uniref:Protein HflK n=1 Tax=Anthurium amnicola TaxID=1678845 RepID=A0A1D1YKZ5_9ARAE
MTSATSKYAFSASKVMTLTVLLIAVILYWPYPQPPGNLAAEFAAITNEAFEQINTFDLPATYVIMDHTVTCRRTANIVERSSVFENSGAQIVTGLRDFGEKVMKAGNALQAMYRKVSYIFEAFQTEFQMILENKSKFSDTSIERLIRLITEFREQVVQVKVLIQDAEKVHKNLEQYLLDGQKEAAKFINADDDVGAMAVKDELDSIKVIFVCLQKAGTNLDMTIKVLRDYLSKASKINARLGNDIYIVTEVDLNYLAKSLKDLPIHHKNFMLKDSEV